MKHTFWIGLGLVIVLIISSCKGGKKDDTLPLGEAGESQVTLFAPIPSFKRILATLDQLDLRDISAAVPAKIYKTKPDTARNSFALGVLTADAIISTRVRNKTNLMAIANEMIRSTSLLNLEAEVSQLNDDIKTFVAKEKWYELEQALIKHKNVVENKLWERGDLDRYTLLKLGGWTEAANRMSWLIKREYSIELTKVLEQKGTWYDIHNNMKLIKSPAIVNESFYQPVLDLITEIKLVLDADAEGTYTKAQIEEIFKLSGLIMAEFQK